MHIYLQAANVQEKYILIPVFSRFVQFPSIPLFPSTLRNGTSKQKVLKQIANIKHSFEAAQESHVK